MKQSLAAASVIMCLSMGATALAQTERERELEQEVRDLNARVEKLESNSAGKPASVTEEEWKSIKKWVKGNSTLRAYWKDGLRLDSNDGSVKLKIGGRIQNDWSYFCEDGVSKTIGSEFEESTEFRRARLYFSGSINGDLSFKVQYDFAGGDADFKDVYMALKKVPVVGNFRVGQFKEPFSLEELTSSNYITFLERSLVNTFAPGRNTGFMIHDTMANKRMTWAAGFFRQTDSFGDGQGGRDYNATARITALPVYEDGGKQLVHVGFAYTKQNYEDDTLRIRARPEAHDAPRVVDTGTFAASHADLIGVEAAWVNGPFSLQGEYVHSFVNGDSRRVGNPDFCAASVQASYFLTGEHRPYKTSAGAFNRVRPLRNFREDGGWGAWEIAGRASYINLNDGAVKGGRLTDYTVGLNWYLNQNVRTMWNFIYGDPSTGGDFSAFLWRFQVAF